MATAYANKGRTELRIIREKNSEFGVAMHFAAQGGREGISGLQTLPPVAANPPSNRRSGQICLAGQNYASEGERRRSNRVFAGAACMEKKIRSKTWDAANSTSGSEMQIMRRQLRRMRKRVPYV